MASHGVTRTHRDRTDEERLADLTRIEEYRELENEIRAAAALQRFQDASLFRSTSKLLRLNPEYYTIWNVRRRCLLTSGFSSRPSPGSLPSTGLSSSSPNATTTTSCDASSTSPSATTPPAPTSPTTGPSGTTPSQQDTVQRDGDIIEDELSFTYPLLRTFPKCYWIWNHRQWILAQAIDRLPQSEARSIWKAELGLVSKMLTLDRRNFHAWGYRRFVVAALESERLAGQSMAEQELEYTEAKIRDDNSNFSAWHNRSLLGPRVLDERGADDTARAAFLEKELEYLRGLINVGPQDQSLWFYHQFLMMQIVPESTRPRAPGSREINYMAPGLSIDQRIAYLEEEIEVFKELVEDYVDIKYLYEALINCTLALEQMGRRSWKKHSERDEHLLEWLDAMRVLDPAREGRWNDLEARMGVSRA